MDPRRGSQIKAMQHYKDGRVIDMRPFFTWFLSLPLSYENRS
jgi:hypothetical protein